MIYSKTGKCRPFSDEADGTVPSDGGGVLLLQRLNDAINDNREIYAVLKGVSLGNDGSSKTSFTAPTSKGQASILEGAIELSGVKKDQIDFIETHGTGTAIGDSVELLALNQTFQNSSRSKRIRLGAVKSNLGHLDVAAGMASLIKVVMSLAENTVLPSIHSGRIPESLGFDDNLFYIPRNVENKIFTKNSIAGVSCFGMGGNNSHALFAKAPVGLEKKIKHNFDYQKTENLLVAEENSNLKVKNPTSKWAYSQQWKDKALSRNQNADLKLRSFAVLDKSSRLGLEIQKELTAKGLSSQLFDTQDLSEFDFEQQNKDVILVINENEDLESYFELFDFLKQDLNSSNRSQIRYFVVYKLSDLKNCPLELSPNQRLFEGFQKSFSVENSYRSWSTIRFQNYKNKRIAELLIQELSRNQYDPEVGYICGQRKIPFFTDIELQEVEDFHAPLVVDDKTYLVTGGLGNMGLLIAKFISKVSNSRIVLTTRRDFPEKSDWHEILVSSDTPKHLKSVLQKLVDIDSQDNEILVKSINLEDEDSISLLKKEIEQLGAKIDGIFHVAGNTQKKDMQKLAKSERRDLDSHFAPKVIGTKNLVAAFQKDSLDFIVMMSSLSTVLGGDGYSHYSAANNYLNGLASSFVESETKFLSINWDGWHFDGKEGYQNLIHYNLLINSDDANDAFYHLFSKDMPSNIYVSATDLEKRILRWKKTAASSLKVVPVTKLNISQGNIKGNLAAIWKKFLSCNNPTSNDDYFLMGGDSLLAIEIVDEIRTQIGVNLGLEEFLSNSLFEDQVKLLQEIGEKYNV